MLKCNNKYGMLCGNCSEFVLEEHDKQIRAKVIDEFVKAIEKNQTHHDSYSSPIEFKMGVDMTDILKIAAQLKEQSNEH